MGRFGVFLLMVSLALVIYGYHAWQEGIFKNPDRQPTGKEKIERRWSIRIKEKAK